MESWKLRPGRKAPHSAGTPRHRKSKRCELGTEQGTVVRVARQLGYGIESVRNWVTQADAGTGMKPGTTTEDADRVGNEVRSDVGGRIMMCPSLGNSDGRPWGVRVGR